MGWTGLGGGGIELDCANSCIASGDVIKGVPGS